MNVCWNPISLPGSMSAQFSLSPPDKNLDAHGSHALTSIVASGSATIGRSFGHSLRRAMSVRHSTGSINGSRYRKHRRSRGNDGERPSSLLSLNSATHRHSGSNISMDTAVSPRHSGTFVDLRPPSSEPESDSISIVSSSSISTVSSSNALLQLQQQQPGPQVIRRLSSTLISHTAFDRSASLPRLPSPRAPSPLIFGGSPPTLVRPPHSSSSSSSLDSSQGVVGEDTNLPIVVHTPV